MDIDVSMLTRSDCVEMLESAGIQCYDDEDTATLREAVRVNVEDGTIPLAVLVSYEGE